MNDVETTASHKRYPWLAIALSLVQPGLGHIYCGRFIRGLVFAFACFIPVLVLQIGLLIGFEPIGMPILVIAVITSVVIPLVAVTDSYYTARNTRSDYKLKDYNRWYVYVLLVLLTTGSSTQIAFNVRAHYLEAFRIPTASMYPTLIPEDRFIVNKVAYERAGPDRGDIVVFVNPEDRAVRFIKRVVAIGGDTVKVSGEDVFINGRALEHVDCPSDILDSASIEYDGAKVTGRVCEECLDNWRYRILFAGAPHDTRGKNIEELVVPRSYCFVLGDNRHLSFDSRHFGPIPIADVLGRVEYLYFPAGDWSRFGRIGP